MIKIPKKIGALFFIKQKPYLRGVGILYAAHANRDPTIHRAWVKRMRRRQEKST